MAEKPSKSLFLRSSKDYRLDEISETYRDKLPIIVVVTQGHQGTSDVDTYAYDDALLLVGHARIHRVRALENSGRYVSLPLEWRKSVTIATVAAKDKESSQTDTNRAEPRSLKELLSTEKLPLYIQLGEGAATSNPATDQRKIWNYLLLHEFEEEVFLGYSIVDGKQVDKKLISVPASLDIRVCVVKDPEREQMNRLAHLHERLNQKEGAAVGHTSIQDVIYPIRYHNEELLVPAGSGKPNKKGPPVHSKPSKSKTASAKQSHLSDKAKNDNLIYDKPIKKSAVRPDDKSDNEKPKTKAPVKADNTGHEVNHSHGKGADKATETGDQAVQIKVKPRDIKLSESSCQEGDATEVTTVEVRNQMKDTIRIISSSDSSASDPPQPSDALYADYIEPILPPPDDPQATQAPRSAPPLPRKSRNKSLPRKFSADSKLDMMTCNKSHTYRPRTGVDEDARCCARPRRRNTTVPSGTNTAQAAPPREFDYNIHEESKDTSEVSAAPSMGQLATPLSDAYNVDLGEPSYDLAPFIRMDGSGCKNQGIPVSSNDMQEKGDVENKESDKVMTVSEEQQKDPPVQVLTIPQAPVRDSAEDSPAESKDRKPCTKSRKKPTRPVPQPPGYSTANNVQLNFDNIPEKAEDFSVGQVAESLRLLNMTHHAEKFAEHLIDGVLLLDLGMGILMGELALSELEAIKLQKFFRDGWRPKL